MAGTGIAVSSSMERTEEVLVLVAFMLLRTLVKNVGVSLMAVRIGDLGE